MLVFENAANKSTYAYADTVDRNKILLYWRYKPTNDDLTTHNISIYRSEGLNATGTKITTIKANNTYYVDTAPWLKDAYRNYYYQLQIDGDTLSEHFTVMQKPTALTLAKRHRVCIDLKFGGVPVLIYQRITDGTRCPKCWNSNMMKSTDKNCSTCYGTTYLGGFYTPVLTLAQLVPPIKQTQPVETFKNPQQTHSFIGYFPIVKPADFVLDLTTGNRWRVVTIQEVSDGAIISQQVELSRMNYGEIEYQLPLPASTLTYVIEPVKGKFFIDFNRLKGVK